MRDAPGDDVAHDELRARLRASLGARYTVSEEIGRGATAIVYAAHDLLHFERDVALKVIRPEVVAAVGVARFQREMQLAAQLNHPHILPLLDWGDADGLLYYVMPRVHGESLRTRLQRDQQLALDHAVRITRDVAGALQHAHGHGIVHRDVKPENILLVEGEASLADFGLAREVEGRRVDPVTASGIAVGTAAYMSPEQASGGGGDARSDQYSLACVLYEMLAGDPPFHASTVQGMLARHRSDAPSHLTSTRPSLPAGVDEAVQRALAKVPADRFASVAQFAQAVEAALTSGTLAAVRAATPAAPQAVRAGGAAKWRRAALGGLAVVAGGWWVVKLLDGPPDGRAPASRIDARQIAVLPIEDQTQNAAYGWLAQGLTSDMIGALGAVSALSVRSLAAVRPFRNTLVPPDSIGRALEVGTLVEGSIQETPRGLRVSARLSDAGTGRLLGKAVDIDVAPNDILAGRDALIDSVASSLRRTLGSVVTLNRRQGEVQSQRAWELLQRADEARQAASEHIDDRDIASARRRLAEADSLLAQAEQEAPRWTEPIVLRGWVANAKASSVLERPDGRCEGDCAAWRREGLAHASRALRIRSDDVAALELRGTLSMQMWWTVRDTAGALRVLDDAERDLRQVVSRDRTRARAWRSLATLYSLRSDSDRRAEATRQALEADAWLEGASFNLSYLFSYALRRGDVQEARRVCERGARKYPEVSDFRECGLKLLGHTASKRDDVAVAWAELHAIEADSTKLIGDANWGYRRTMIAAVIARAGLRDSALSVIRGAARRRDKVGPYWRGYEAYIHVLVDDVDRALTLMEEEVKQDPLFRDFAATHPWYAPLRGQPRFEALIRGAPRQSR